MNKQLTVSLGQYSDKGQKKTNQDFHGACIPYNSQLDLKGIALAVADGISSSDVSDIASETAIKTFLEDYYCTSDAWSVKTSAQKVLSAINSWLYAQGQTAKHRFENNYDKNKGYICTFSAMVLKSNTAHIFHVGDTRIYRVSGKCLEKLTHDHRLWVDKDKHYLSRALGIEALCEFDYQRVLLQKNDVFIIASDGVYEWLDDSIITETINQYSNDFDLAAKEIVAEAIKAGSDDNLTVQVIRVDNLPQILLSEVQDKVVELPLPPLLEPREKFDGYTIQRKLHSSSRSHVYLAQDSQTGDLGVIKAPSVELSHDPIYLERLLTEEWVARKINNGHVLKAGLQGRPRKYLYTVSEFLRGKTLTQWAIDNPRPSVERVRNIVEQIAKGLRAFHRLEILHQDIKPDNIMIDNNDTIKIIDFGAVKVAGLAECSFEQGQEPILGTALFTAPEYFLGEEGTIKSEQFSLGVITYYLLSGRFPYSTKVSSARTTSAQKRLAYRSIVNPNYQIPMWIDEAIKKSVHINPGKRYDEITEFIYDLRHPNKNFLNKERPPLLERNPVLVWQGVSLFLLVLVIYLLTD